MPIEVIMPQMGESIAEGTLVRWLKEVGESVRRDEPLFEISTDKVDTEIPSPDDGVLSEIKVREGETVAVQTVVALLDGNKQTGEAPSGLAKSSQETAEAAVSSLESIPVTEAESPARAAPPPSPPPRDRPRHHRSSPLVRRMAAEHDLDLSTIQGTGSGGRVTKKDILEVIEKRKAQPPQAAFVAPPKAAEIRHSFPPTDITVEPLPQMRLKIAEHMVMSKQTSPHVTTVHEVDMTAIATKIANNKKDFLRKNGAKLTYLPFITKALVSGLKEYSIINACMVGEEIHYFKRINIGIAVALDEGLIVPVIKDADDKSLVGLARAIQDLATRARSKKLQPDEVTGGTFTVSNYGVFGSLFATPVINQPQAAVLGVGAVVKRPVVLPNTDAIAIRSMMYLSLSFDHRLVDGATADQFIAHVRNILESAPYNPMES